MLQRAYTSKELMEIDDRIMHEYQQMRSAQKLASEEAKRARERQRRHPPKRHGYDLQIKPDLFKTKRRDESFLAKAYSPRSSACTGYER